MILLIWKCEIQESIETERKTRPKNVGKDIYN